MSGESDSWSDSCLVDAAIRTENLLMWENYLLFVRLFSILIKRLSGLPVEGSKALKACSVSLLFLCCFSTVLAIWIVAAIDSKPFKEYTLWYVSNAQFSAQFNASHFISQNLFEFKFSLRFWAQILSYTPNVQVLNWGDSVQFHCSIRLKWRAPLSCPFHLELPKNEVHGKQSGRLIQEAADSAAVDRVITGI